MPLGNPCICPYVPCPIHSANPHDPPVQTVKQARHQLDQIIEEVRCNGADPSLIDPAEDALILAARAEGRAEAQQEIEKLKAKLAYTTSAREMLLEQGNTRLEAERAAAEAEVTRLKELADDLALWKLCPVHQPNVWESDGTCPICEGHRLAEEVTRLSSLLAQREQAQDYLIVRYRSALVGKLEHYAIKVAAEVLRHVLKSPPAPQEPTK